MSDQVFPTNGEGIPPMRARKELMDEVWSALTKAGTKSGSSNLSIIAPRWIGKTVLLKAIADRAVADDDSPYALVFHWHLGHVCPTTDAEFISGLCMGLDEVLEYHEKDYSLYQDALKKKSFTDLKLITDYLHDDDDPVLFLWDGLDKPLGQENLSVHLWDQMRSIIDGKKHKIVTATRAPMDLLIANEDASTSEFWNIFDENFIGPFNETDLDTLLQIAHLELNSGGKKGVFNWTGGHPKLLLELLNRLKAGNFSSPISNDIVAEVAKGMGRDVRRLLRTIWDECSQEVQGAYQSLVKNGEIALSEIGTIDADALKARGFISLHRKKAKHNCHLLEDYLSNTSRDSGSLALLFKDPDDYEANIGDVLRMRVGQIPSFDNDLQRWVSQAVLRLSDHPGDCMSNINDIRDRALDLIVAHEFGSNREVPADIAKYWKGIDRLENKSVNALCEKDSYRVPDNSAFQVGLIQVLTGGIQGVDSRAKSVSKDTAALLSAIHGLRNRKIHANRQPITFSVAVATIAIYLALLQHLAEELTSNVQN